MPRYFFNVHDGVVLRDDEGIELSSRSDVYGAALKRAAEVLRDHPESWGKVPWILEVVDERGASVMKVGVHAASVDPEDVADR